MMCMSTKWVWVCVAWPVFTGLGIWLFQDARERAIHAVFPPGSLILFVPLVVLSSPTIREASASSHRSWLWTISATISWFFLYEKVQMVNAELVKQFFSPALIPRYVVHSQIFLSFMLIWISALPDDERQQHRTSRTVRIALTAAALVTWYLEMRQGLGLLSHSGLATGAAYQQVQLWLVHVTCFLYIFLAARVLVPGTIVAFGTCLSDPKRSSLDVMT